MKDIVKLFFALILCFAAGAAELVPQKFADGPGGALLCRGKYLYATLKNKLCIYDVSSPLSPKLISSLPAYGRRQFALSGNLLYLSCRENGVQIYDVQNPAVPKVLNRFYPIELATGLTVSGNVLGVAQRVYGVEFFDVTDPMNPRSMGRLRTAEAQSAVFFGKGKIAVGNWGSGQVVIGDVTNPAYPETLSICSLSGMGDGVAVRGNHLFAVTGRKISRSSTNGHGLEIFDISDVKSPVPVSRVEFPLVNMKVPDWWQVIVTGRTAFAADSHSGVYIIDISDIESPKIKNHLKLPDDAASRITTGDGVLYISGHKTGLYLQPCKDAEQILPPYSEINPVQASEPPAVHGLQAISVPGFVWSLTVSGNRLYASCGCAGLREYFIGKDGSLSPEKVYAQNCFDCKIYGSLLFAAGGDFLYVYDMKNNRLLSRTPGAGGRKFFQLHLYDHGKLLVSSDRSSTLQFWDVSNPEGPELVSRSSGHSIHYTDMFPEMEINGIFPVNWHTGSPVWYQSGKRPDPFFCKMDTTNYPSSQMCGITVCRGKFILFARNHKVLLLDPDNPQQYTVLNVKHDLGIPSSSGNTVVLSNRKTGNVTFYTFDGKTLLPAADRRYKLPFTVTGRAVFFNDKVYIPAGSSGIYREK